MKKIHAILTLITVIIFLTLCCNNDTTVKVKYDSEVLEKELDEAFKNLWPNVTLSKADEFFKTSVSDDFYTINADGIVQNKAQLLADKKRLEMLEVLDFKFFDQVIKVYGTVGIVNGRIQAFSEGTFVGEVLYTAVFIRKNDTWLYKNWQGTWSINSPPPPSFISG